MTGHDLATGRLELGDQRLGHAGRPAADHRPPDRVRVRGEDQPERGTQRAIEAEHRVGRHAREQRPGRLVVEPCARQAPCRPERRQAEPGERQRVSRHVDDRPQDLGPELLRVAHQRPEQPAPGPAVRPAEAVGRGLHGSLEDRRAATIERVGERARPGGRARRRGPRGRSTGRTARRWSAAGSSSRRRGGSRGASARRSASRRRPSARPRRHGPSARHGPA